jgi:flagellar hook-associated protein 3 FlgL
MYEDQTSTSRVDTGDKSQLIAIFDQLIKDLRDDNTEGLSKGLSRIEKQSDNINAIRAELGVKMNRVELTTNRILDDTLNLKELLSKNEDADIAEVIMNLMMQEYVYKASLSGGARVIQPTLVDFLS